MRKTTCSGRSCNNPTRSPNQRYCRGCHAENNRKNRKQSCDYTPLERMKAHARSLANNARRDGKLIPKPCQCGSIYVEMHHHDYSKPLEITWICQKCHLDLHENERNMAKTA